MFPSNYNQAREQFRRRLNNAGASLYVIPIEAFGPEGLTLTIDIGWLGSFSAKKLLVVQSGVHGIEAFSGSAIQRQISDNFSQLPSDIAILMVHVLNPHGMAWLRRVNENNVDINRNCLPQGEVYRGVAQGYVQLNTLINPMSPPSRDGFYLRALYRALRHGFGTLKQAIAQGQYEYPQGLFYGGTMLQQGPQRYQEWLRQNISSVERLLVIDFHSGLGEYGKRTIFSRLPMPQEFASRLQEAYEHKVIVYDSQSVAYVIRGGVSSLYSNLFENKHPIYLTVEFGTYSPFKVLHALREENRWHFYGSGGLGHAAKLRLKEALSPSNLDWQRGVMEQGQAIVQQGLSLLSSF